MGAEACNGFTKSSRGFSPSWFPRRFSVQALGRVCVLEVGEMLGNGYASATQLIANRLRRRIRRARLRALKSRQFGRTWHGVEPSVVSCVAGSMEHVTKWT